MTAAVDPMERLVAFYDAQSSVKPETPCSIYADVNGQDVLVERRCGQCDTFKPVVEMMRNAHCPDGVGYRCRACHNERTRVRRRGIVDRLEDVTTRLEDLVSTS